MAGAGDRFDAVLVSGGDGTLNHAVDTLLRYGLTLPVGYLPQGSTNDFARSLYGGRLPKPDSVCRAVAEGRRFSCDIGRFNDRHFTYVAALGVFTKVSYTTPQNMKNALGYGAYLLNLVSAVADLPNSRMHIRYTHDGVCEEGDFILGAITNTTSVGGLKPRLIQRAEMSDGYFELTMIRAPGSLLEWNETLAAAMTGGGENPYVSVCRAQRVQLSFEREIAWTLDGEPGGEHRSADIRVAPKAVDFFVPGA